MPNLASLPTEVATFDRPNGERLVAGFSYFKGKPYVSIRVYYRDPEGNWAPGKNGLNLPLAEFKNVTAAVVRLNEVLATVEAPTNA